MILDISRCEKIDKRKAKRGRPLTDARAEPLGGLGFLMRVRPHARSIGEGVAGRNETVTKLFDRTKIVADATSELVTQRGAKWRESVYGD